MSEFTKNNLVDSSSEAKCLNREAIHLPPSRAKVQNNSTSAVRSCGVQRTFLRWNMKQVNGLAHR